MAQKPKFGPVTVIDTRTGEKHTEPAKPYVVDRQDRFLESRYSRRR